MGFDNFGEEKSPLLSSQIGDTYLKRKRLFQRSNLSEKATSSPGKMISPNPMIL